MTLPSHGQSLPTSAPITVSAAQVAAYLDAAGDDNPLHTDPAVAALAGLAGCPVPGMLLAGLAMAHLGDVPEVGPASIAIRFVGMVLVGQTVTITGKVVAQDGDGTSVVRLLVTAQKLAAIVEVTLTRLR